jgi:hypothetical protein
LTKSAARESSVFTKPQIESPFSSTFPVLFGKSAELDSTRANVYVNTVRKSSHTSVSIDIYSGGDGPHLGETPVTIPIKRRARKRYPPLSVVVRAGVDGCPTYWQIVSVANWGTSPQEAADASKKNEVLFIVDDKDVVCTR